MHLLCHSVLRWVVDQAIGSSVPIEERDELPISVVHHRDLSCPDSRSLSEKMTSEGAWLPFARGEERAPAGMGGQFRPASFIEAHGGGVATADQHGNALSCQRPIAAGKQPGNQNRAIA